MSAEEDKTNPEILESNEPGEQKRLSKETKNANEGGEQRRGSQKRESKDVNETGEQKRGSRKSAVGEQRRPSQKVEPTDAEEDEDEDEMETEAEAKPMQPALCRRRGKKAKSGQNGAAGGPAPGYKEKEQVDYEEICGEGDDGELECYTPARLQNNIAVTKADEIRGEQVDDDWDYYYVPCDPSIDGNEDDEEEGEHSPRDEGKEEPVTAPPPSEMVDYEDTEEEEEEEEVEEEEEEEEEEDEDEFDEDEEEDEDDLKTLFLSQEDDQPEDLATLNLKDIEGVVGITLSSKTKQFFEVEDEEMFQGEDPVYKWLSWKKVKLHIFMNGEESEFFEHYKSIKYYPDVTMLLGSDPTESTGHKYFFCLTVEARNNVLNPKRRKRVKMNKKAQQEQIWLEMASKAPRKWRGYGSELEVDAENVIDTRPLLSVQVYRYRQHFGSRCKFADAPKTDANKSQFSATFVSEPLDAYPCVYSTEVDRATQVNPQRADMATQTGFSFKRNKMVQYAYQSITEKNVENIMGSRDMAKFFRKVMPRLDKVLQQNEMVDLLHDDYRNLKCKQGHEMEFSTDSLLLQEYQTYSDYKHSKGRMVTCMTFHPALEDVVVMATAVDLTWERRIDAHSKSLMEPNYVIFWDLRDSAHPQVMLDAPADVFSFQINPAEPSLVCGGCANGQIALWDLGRTYFELRAKIQDRRNMTSEGKVKRPTFLDKLKDSAETLSCPLIPVSGLSNLDVSHKRAVTKVVWVPPHVEVGKNGMTYENNNGRSQQFMSVAGDGTLRLWDIRPQKKGIAEEDEDGANNVMKANKWAHLENNQWKFHFKYALADSNGSPLFATTIQICEKRSAPTKKMEDEPSAAPSVSEPVKENAEGDSAANAAQVPTPSQKKLRGQLLQNLNASTTLFVGTETGETGMVDWLRNAEGDPAPDFGFKTATTIFMQTFHHGAITCMRRSPFYPEMLLVVGGGTISIWKETCPYPIFLSGAFDVFPWCAIWSNSRPAVFYVGNREGSVSVWDLMDRSNGPVMTQPVTNVSITDIGIPKIAVLASKNQYLAVTDSEGTLLVLLLPRFYARPLQTEDHVMTELMNREDHRMTTWMKELEERADKIQTVNTNWQQSRISKSPDETSREEIEQEGRLNEEYVQFLEFEQSLTGALKENEPAVPTMDAQNNDEFDAMIAAAQKEEEVAPVDDFEDDDDDWDRDFDDEDYDV